MFEQIQARLDKVLTIESDMFCEFLKAFNTGDLDAGEKIFAKIFRSSLLAFAELIKSLRVVFVSYWGISILI